MQIEYSIGRPYQFQWFLHIFDPPLFELILKMFGDLHVSQTFPTNRLELCQHNFKVNFLDYCTPICIMNSALKFWCLGKVGKNNFSILCTL